MFKSGASVQLAVVLFYLESLISLFDQTTPCDMIGPESQTKNPSIYKFIIIKTELLIPSVNTCMCLCASMDFEPWICTEPAPRLVLRWLVAIGL